MSRPRHFDLYGFVACLVLVLVHDPALAREVRPPGVQQATYTVQPGDVLSVISERQGVSLELLRKVNAVPTDTIRPGQVLLLPTPYEVKPGDTLGAIAERYGVPLRTLLDHNDLAEHSVLKVGQRIVIAGGAHGQAAPNVPSTSKSADAPVPAPKPPAPPPPEPEPKAATEYYEHEVRKNEVLSILAARYASSTEELRRINQLGKKSLIHVGQRLKVPVTDANAHLTRPKPWTQYARTTFERGKVTLTTMGGSWTGRVLDAKGAILPEARRHIQSMLASWETGKQEQAALHPQLYQLIVTVSDEFGGRPIRVVSGYRQRSFAPHSKHRAGCALDFSIPGVPNSAIVDFLLTVPNTGVGYYPNATHVHMDTRSGSMHWVDTSGPGQAPRYVHKSNTGQRAPVVAKTSPLAPSPRHPALKPQRRRAHQHARHNSEATSLLATR